MRRGPSSSRIDLGVLEILGDVVVEWQPPRGVGRDDEVEVVRTPIGEHDGGQLVASEEVPDVGGQLTVEVRAPERPMVAGVLDDRSRVAHQRGVQAQLLADRPSPPIPAARAEDRADSRPAALATASAVRRRKVAVRVEQRSINIQRQHSVSGCRHDFRSRTESRTKRTEIAFRRPGAFALLS